MRLTIGSKQKAIEAIQSLDVDKVWILDISEKKSKRSIPQNALYWAWLTVIENTTGNCKDDLHEFFKQKFLGYEVNEVLNETIEKLRTTTKLNTKSFTDYLECIRVFVAVELGIRLLTPQEEAWEQFCNEFQIKL